MIAGATGTLPDVLDSPELSAMLGCFETIADDAIETSSEHEVCFFLFLPLIWWIARPGRALADGNNNRGTYMYDRTPRSIFS